jgi:hypothetical protein
MHNASGGQVFILDNLTPATPKKRRSLNASFSFFGVADKQSLMQRPLPPIYVPKKTKIGVLYDKK